MDNNIFIQNKYQSGRYISNPETASNIINNKMNNKYNPDVMNNYNTLENRRTTEQFNITKKMYKPIIQDNTLENIDIRTQDDFKIKICNDNNDINEQLNIRSRERDNENNELNNIYTDINKNNFEKKFNFFNDEIFIISKTVSETQIDHNYRKDISNSYYIDQKKDLDKDKDKYNEIINSLNKKKILE